MILRAIFYSLFSLFFCEKGIALKITNPFKPGSTVVTIGGNTTTLTRSTSCEARKWENSQENACTCCIVKHGLKPDGNFKYDGDHVSYCLEKKHCTEEILDEMADALDITYDEENPRPFIKAIIQSALETANAGTLGDEYHDGSRLTPQGVIKALSIMASKDKIKNDKKTIEQCFQAQPLGGGGSQTIQLFLVSQNAYCNRQSKIGLFNPDGVYIIKELKKGQKEIKNTALIKDSFLAKYSLSNPNRPQGFPAIALDDVSFNYKDPKQRTHYLAVLPLAPGDSVFNILKNFAESYKSHKKNGTLASTDHQNAETRAKHAILALGQQVGRLHSRYMTRDKNGRLTGKSKAVHGDMHPNNIFEDIKHNIIFIDPETFAIGLKSPRSVGKDLLRIYLFSTIRSAAHQNPRKGNVNQTYWHQTIIKPFLREYIRAYAFLDDKGNITETFNENNFNDVMRILHRTFSFSGSLSDPEAFYLKAGPIGSLIAYKKYISKILDELEEEIRDNPKTGGLNLQEELVLSGARLRKVAATTQE